MISLQKKLLILTRIVVLFHLNLHNIIIGIKNHPFLYNSFFKKEGSNKDSSIEHRPLRKDPLQSASSWIWLAEIGIVHDTIRVISSHL